ncbi:hypothetical protein HID58_034284 [Brassica napus]|uniref:Uncharacterized protein n=1 Tax=Brassica napus TaxID=3708 RepID=A0ABQ8C1P9_BRANA|nr:hypothetical protein HID58_034284 [Brassica napus]
MTEGTGKSQPCRGYSLIGGGVIGLLSEALSCNDKFGCFAAGAIIERCPPFPRPVLASIGMSSVEERDLYIGYVVSPWFADFSGGGLRVCLVLTLSLKEFPCLSNHFWNEMLAEFTPT